MHYMCTLAKRARLRNDQGLQVAIPKLHLTVFVVSMVVVASFEIPSDSK